MNSLFLGCFAFGLIFTVASFVLGALGGHDFHLPHVGGHGFGHGGGHGAGHGAHGAHGGAHGETLSPFNLSTISAFVTWFGGAGWLLTRYSSFTAAVIMLAATASGVVGGGTVFVALSRLIMRRLTVMRPEDYREQGVVGRLTSPIRAGGTGEVVYTLGGSRRVDGARTLDGQALGRGTEVIIHRVEHGIAFVERWDDFARNNQLPAGDSAAVPPGESP